MSPTIPRIIQLSQNVVDKIAAGEGFFILLKNWRLSYYLLNSIGGVFGVGMLVRGLDPCDFIAKGVCNKGGVNDIIFLPDFSFSPISEGGGFSPSSSPRSGYVLCM